MELNKFENQIKNKLEGRAIQPSAKSWDRLDAMLSVKEKPKNKSFVWYYVAASLFFVFGITYWFINQDATEIIPQSTIVTTEKEDVLQVNETENSSKNELEIKGLIEEVQTNNNSVIVQNQVVKKSKIYIENKEITSKNEVVVVNQNNDNQIIENNQQPIINNPQKFVSPEKLLASVENSQENISITHSKKTNNSIKVNANSLLSSVENEIKEEYRETTFDKLKRKFNETKSAVVNRNYE